MKSSVVAMIGEGILAEIVWRELSSHYEVMHQHDFNTGVPMTSELVLVLVVQDDWEPAFYLKAEKILRTTKIPWLSGYITSDEGIVGPTVYAGKPGCSQCADMRRLVAGRNRPMSEQQMKQFLNGESEVNEVVSRSAFLQVAYLLISEVHRILQGQQAYTDNHIYIFNLVTWDSSLHFILPDSQCTICGDINDDSQEASVITLIPNWKKNETNFRSLSLHDIKDVLVKEYLDDRTGLAYDKQLHHNTTFADVTVKVPLFYMDEVAGGRSHSYEQSELIAILEGIERYSGVVPRGKRTIVTDSYRNLAEQALDPTQVGLYADDQYLRDDFPFEPYDSNMPMDWVWGYSFLQEHSILVPQSLAYYSMNNNEHFVAEGSNGSALGGSLAEAVLHGIFEVVERDAFLMTWYAQLSVPELDVFSTEDQELKLMIERLQHVEDCDVRLFNITMENGIPSIWAIAKNRKSTGANLNCAAGAHLDPVRAAKSAIQELAGIKPLLNMKMETEQEIYLEMLQNPSLVTSMEDHAMLYSLPQAEKRLHFLLADKKHVQSFQQAFMQINRHSDVTDDLKDVLQVFKRLNLDVIVVNQTSPETLRNGLHCVKVLIPGMIPMTFGHHLTRLTGLKRLWTVPVELGYRKQPLTKEQLNPHPHPFP